MTVIPPTSEIQVAAMPVNVELVTEGTIWRVLKH